MNETFMKEKPILPLITSMAMPMVISMLVNSLYNIVDSFFVAQISEDAMTALSLVFPIQNLITAVAVGFGVGINAVISFHLGAKEETAANIAATHGLAYSLLHGILITIGTILFMPVFLRMFTSEAEVIDLGIRYASIAFSFSIVIMASITFEKLYQATGRMKITMAGLLCGCLMNIVLDPLMIFGFGWIPEMGIEGAALASGIGQVLTLVIYLIVYQRTTLPIKLGKGYLKAAKSIDRRLYFIGIPATLNLALPSLLISCLNGMLSAYSQTYVVILGIYYKLQTFLYLPANGIVQGMRPIIGYNYGAKEYERVKHIYKCTLCMCSGIMIIGTILCLVQAQQLIALFTSNPMTISGGKAALRIICAGFIVSAVSVTSMGALEGLGKGIQSLVISMCRYVLFILPIAYLLCHMLGAEAIWHAFWISETLTACIAYVVYQRTIKGNVKEKESVRKQKEKLLIKEDIL